MKNILIIPGKKPDKIQIENKNQQQKNNIN